MKKFIATFLIFLITISSFATIGVFAAKPITVMLNGNLIEFDVQPINVNGRILVPVRAIFEALGATVEWNGAKNEVVATKENITIRLYKDDTTMYKNNESITIDVPAKNINDRILVPVRAISESFGCNVDWDGTKSQVIIVTNKSSSTASKEEVIKRIQAMGYSTAYEYPIPDYISVTGAIQDKDDDVLDAYGCRYDNIYKLKADILSYCNLLEDIGFVWNSLSDVTLQELKSSLYVPYDDIGLYEDSIVYTYNFGDKKATVIISWSFWLFYDSSTQTMLIDYSWTKCSYKFYRLIKMYCLNYYKQIGKVIKYKEIKNRRYF